MIKQFKARVSLRSQPGTFIEKTIFARNKERAIEYLKDLGYSAPVEIKQVYPENGNP